MPDCVTPAKAGVQFFLRYAHWIPAFAGMTTWATPHPSRHGSAFRVALPPLGLLERQSERQPVRGFVVRAPHPSYAPAR